MQRARTRGILVASLAACGRLDFDDRAHLASDADRPGGHDEDGDGVPDSIDVCPARADDQTDTDGDGVGVAIACDPEPDDPRGTSPCSRR